MGIGVGEGVYIGSSFGPTPMRSIVMRFVKSGYHLMEDGRKEWKRR
jgi:hypothetical protein